MSTALRSRMGRVLGYDGPVATLMLTVFQYFLVSLSFVAALAPLLVFQALVGWQGTHLALWLGAGAALPLAPGLQALVRAGEALLDGARGAATYWRDFAVSVRTRWMLSFGVAGGVLLLGYDVALLGATGEVLVVAAIVAAALVVLVIADAVLPERTPLSLARIAACAQLVARRPHLALAWLLLAVIACASTAIPILGAAFWLFAPALAAVAAVICTRALGVPAVLIEGKS